MEVYLSVTLFEFFEIIFVGKISFLRYGMFSSFTDTRVLIFVYCPNANINRTSLSLHLFPFSVGTTVCKLYTAVPRTVCTSQERQSIVPLVITFCMARDFLTFRRKMLPSFSECSISLNPSFILKMKTAWSPKHLNKRYNDQKTTIWTTIRMKVLYKNNIL